MEKYILGCKREKNGCKSEKDEKVYQEKEKEPTG